MGRAQGSALYSFASLGIPANPCEKVFATIENAHMFKAGCMEFPWTLFTVTIWSLTARATTGIAVSRYRMSAIVSLD